MDVETAPDASRRELWAAKQQDAEQGGKEFVPALVPEFCRVVALG